MTDNTLDPKTFDIADWLVGGTEHRLTRSVEIYRNRNLQARVDDLERRERLASRVARDAEGNPEEALGDSTPDALESEREALLQEIQDAKATVTVYALIDSELDEVKALDLKPNTTAWWYEVFARAARIEGNQLTAGQWAKVHETIGAQLATVITAYQAAAEFEQVPSAPFSLSASRKGTPRK